MKLLCVLVALLLATQCFASEQQSACAVCELVVQVAENYVENNATLAEIEAKALALCDDLPSPYNTACDGIVTNNLPQIVAWLENNEPPQTICTQLTLCSSAAEEKIEEAKRAIEQSPCAVCELVVQVAETYIANNATDQQIEAKLDALCNDLPSPYNGECTLIVNSYLPQIITWIQNNEPPATLCAQLSLCSSVKAAKRAIEQSPCAVCELVVQVAETYIANNATDQQIEAKLDALCNDLPSPYNGECTLIVNSYLPQIITWIQNDEPPATLCAQLSLCSSKVVKRAVEQSPCAVCELVVQVAETYIANNATDQQIEAKLDALCNDLPSPYNGECTLIVNSYLPQIITWIQNNEPPATLCAQLSLCSSKAAPKVVKRETEQSVCAVCELVVQVAENYIENNATLSQIEAKLDAVCGDLPSPYNGECVLIVNSYLPQIVQWIEANEPPATLCGQLSLCSAQAAPKVVKVKRETEQSVCAVCEIVIQIAESYISSGQVLAALEAKLDEVCNSFPSPYNGECVLIVNTYLPQVATWIQNNEDPATLCGQLSLCSSMKKPLKREVSQSPCAVCELVVQVAESYIENNATLTQIEAKLDAVCNDLPSPYNGECVLIVNSYLPQLVEYIQNNESPATFCSQISLCSSLKKKGISVHN